MPPKLKEAVEAAILGAYKLGLRDAAEITSSQIPTTDKELEKIICGAINA